MGLYSVCDTMSHKISGKEGGAGINYLKSLDFIL